VNPNYMASAGPRTRPAKIVVHSFMRETGKTNIAAGLGRLVAARGVRTGLVDADLRAPVLHSRLGVDANDFGFKMNDCLLGRCTVFDAAIELALPGDAIGAGALWLAPASPDPVSIRDALSLDIDVRGLDSGIDELASRRRLDVALINAPAGLDELSLSCIALADILILVLRLDKEDYHGTSVILDVARGLNVPDIYLVVSRAGPEYPASDVRARVEQTYQRPVPLVLTAADEAALIFSSNVSPSQWRAHPLADLLHVLRVEAL